MRCWDGEWLEMGRAVLYRSIERKGCVMNDYTYLDIKIGCFVGWEPRICTIDRVYGTMGS